MHPFNQSSANARLLCTVTSRDERFATLAMSEADKSNMKYHQHGCVAVVGGRIIERGCNSDRCQSSDGFLDNTCSCHAEVDVMRKLDRRINKKKTLQVSGRNARSCFLWEGKPIRRKKRQAWGEI